MARIKRAYLKCEEVGEVYEAQHIVLPQKTFGRAGGSVASGAVVPVERDPTPPAAAQAASASTSSQPSCRLRVASANDARIFPLGYGLQGVSFNWYSPKFSDYKVPCKLFF